MALCGMPLFRPHCTSLLPLGVMTGWRGIDRRARSIEAFVKWRGGC